MEENYEQRIMGLIISVVIILLIAVNSQREAMERVENRVSIVEKYVEEVREDTNLAENVVNKIMSELKKGDNL